MLQSRIIPYRLQLKKPAGTSRGIYTTRQVWYVLLTDTDKPGARGIGECAPLPALSCDHSPHYEDILEQACRQLEREGALDTDTLRPWPSILFGLETAMRHLERNGLALWDTPFSQGREGIVINGLIWMDRFEAMLDQINQKLESGYRCIKLKIGAIDFDEELALLAHIRRQFPSDRLQIRVDANGAFEPQEVLSKLQQLSRHEIHSIEQPIKAGQWDVMAQVAANSPVPIALDEELIGCNNPKEKGQLLATIKPQYIILKPSLHGGMAGCREWINLAERLRVGWWLTSALESNIGLNAIAQFCATLGNPIPQGLGTGGLYVNNIDLPLDVSGDTLWFRPGLPPSCLSLFDYNTDRKQQTITLEGRQYTAQDILGMAPDDKTPSHLREVYDFLAEWFKPSDTLEVMTSGSTGSPKRIEVSKQKMINSACMTCSRLGLKPGDKALLCMSLTYIGGKMMIVRALTAGLDLIVRPADGHPLASIDSPLDFAAMVPLQIYNTLGDATEKNRLETIRNVIIGGGPIDQNLEERLRELPNKIYSTYGMTETLSHIALRRINGAYRSRSYAALPGVKLSVAEGNGTLVIDAPALSDQTVYTHDLVQFDAKGNFQILGRSDNIIISGGVKLIPEQIERTLEQLVKFRFAIVPVPDPRLGEATALLGERRVEDEVRQKINDTLSRYERPALYMVADIPRTPNGKIDRMACKQLARDLCRINRDSL